MDIETTETGVEQTDEIAAEESSEESTELDDATQEKLGKLRSEAHELRKRTKAAEARAEELARELFTAHVAATGKVENPAEIPYAADILDDPGAIDQAIDAAIAERPYIRSRKVTGDAGQGQRGESAAPKDFSALFR